MANKKRTSRRSNRRNRTGRPSDSRGSRHGDASSVRSDGYGHFGSVTVHPVGKSELSISTGNDFTFIGHNDVDALVNYLQNWLRKFQSSGPYR